MMLERWSMGITDHDSDDVYWQAKVQSEIMRAPHLEETIKGGCARCRLLKMPLLDAEGQIVGAGILEQVVFGEWQSGASAILEDHTGCHRCHPPADDGDRIARELPWLEKQAHALRVIVGSDTETLSLLAMETALQGGDPAPLLALAAAGRELLNRAGEIELLDVALKDGNLEFAIRIGNLAGHRLPTGFPSRRVYLHAVVENHRGEIVFESGAMRNDGRIVGVDSDENPVAFEPHHRAISSPDQVQVYETVLGNTENDVTVTLLRASQVLKDNRIVPPGFDPMTAFEDIRPRGECMNDPDFGLGQDEVIYQLAGLVESRYLVTVELRHQAIGYPYLRDLAGFSDDPVVSRFLDLYDAVRPGSELIAELVFEVGG